MKQPEKREIKKFPFLLKDKSMTTTIPKIPSRYPIYKVEFYRAGFLKKWRWRVTADNGKITGASSQGYWNKEECEYNAKSLGASLVEI